MFYKFMFMLNMENILSRLLDQNNKIERDISRLGTLDNGEICSDIIIKLRTFVEHIATYHYVVVNSLPNVVTRENIKLGIALINKDKNLKFLKDLHKFLQACASHYVVSEVTSSRLILKYLPYLFEIKLWMKKQYNVDLLTNLNELSRLQETRLHDYYFFIKENMKKIIYSHTPIPKDRYYVYSCLPIFVDNILIYETTLGIASDYASKFNRFIVFSLEEMPKNYSIRCEFIDKIIKLKKYNTSIRIVQDWCISIRPCEINNFGKILGNKENISSTSTEYNRLMLYLMEHKTNLLEIATLNQNEYDEVKKEILLNVKEMHIFNILDSARKIINSHYSEKNLIKYLLYNLNNKIIKEQSSSIPNNIGLYVSKEVCPFCSLPFAMFLHNHNPSLIDLIEVFGEPVKCELIYRKIKNKTESENILYHKINELFEENLEDIKKEIKVINDKLSWAKERNKNIQIENIGELYYIKSYEDSTIYIINNLMQLSSNGITGYSEFAKNKINEYHIDIDSEEKKNVLLHLFENTRVKCIYGSAGTGKSYLARLISDIYKDSRKVYISNTNTAVNNMYQKVGGDIKNFMTIKKYLRNGPCSDLLFIDECSTVNNEDMCEIIKQNKFKALILMGDIIQIESIKFGNWYKLAKTFLENKSKIELKKMHRTSSYPLKLLWDKVRNKENFVDEILSQYCMVSDFDDDSLLTHNQDEIVLALNYNGLYGINNLNNIMQENNKNLSCHLWNYTYKIDDPILFTDNNQYAQTLYNNLKGKIISFNVTDNKITFVIEVETIINEMDLSAYEDVILLSVNDGKSLISIVVDKKFDSDKDEDKSKLVPFQIAYAVSIHKSQGLEFKSVKIVICDDIDDEITHNIFYTAITRSTDNLKIYWSSDTQIKILNRILIKADTRDISILANKENYKIRN